jgi:hypothetical protein
MKKKERRNRGGRERGMERSREGRGELQRNLLQTMVQKSE